jgi:phosphate-selective porin OprO/OprP
LTRLVAITTLGLTGILPGRTMAQSNEELLGIIRDQQRQIEELSRRLERVEERPEPPPATAAAPAPAPAPSDLELSWGPSPTLRSTDGLFEAHLRGRLFVDGGFLEDDDDVYDTRATELRAARLGIEGAAWRDFEYRLEVDFADDEVDITDAFVEYNGAPIEPAYVRVGQFKTPNSLEEQTSSRFITFMERAGFTDAFDLNRRIGAQVGAGTDDWSLAAGVFGQNTEEVSEDEGYAAAARGTYAFRFAEDRLVHVGASTRYRGLDNDSDGDTVRYRQRPFFHFTSTRSVDTGDIEDAESDLLFGGEAALVREPFSLQAEAAHTWLYRDGADDVDGLWGGYLSASYFLTGESRTYDGEDGAFGRIKPREPLHEGGLGAWEIAARLDYLDLNGHDLDVDAGEQVSYIAGVNWYPNANMRLMLDGALTHVEDGEDSPGVVGDSNTIYGLGMRAQVDF